jgi:RHS repeat-associated protein
VLFKQARTFDGAGNVSTANTTLSGGTDNQAFCYDEQNRLTAAASSGTVPCQTFTPGSLSAANYNQSFTYDTMGRLTSGPLGIYTYGSSAHTHAATAIGSAYTAAYDAAGDMTCRAPSSATTCSGTPTGALLSFNNEGQLANWQNQPSSPTSTAAFLYDGQGNRVAQQTTSGGTTTTTVYVGSVEEDSTTGGTTTKTTYYYANGSRVAMAVNGAFSYLCSDGIGSANATLAANGTVTASLLYTPYGAARYSSGNMPTDYGFTGQHSDVTSGLDYYNARYYDPIAAQFTSADTVLPGKGFDVFGLSRYAYVEGNPILRTDPTGHCSTVQCYIDVNDPNSAGVSSQENSKGGEQIVAREALSALAYSRAHPATKSPAGSGVYDWLNSHVGYWIGNQDYYTAGVGFNTPLGLGLQLSVSVTPDKVYITNGVGFGTPGPSVFGNGGHLLQPNPSPTDIDSFVSGPSLVAGGAPGGFGVNTIWGNEGQFNKNAVGIEIVGGTKQVGIYQTNSVDTADANFWSDFLGPIVPINAS